MFRQLVVHLGLFLIKLWPMSTPLITAATPHRQIINCFSLYEKYIFGFEFKETQHLQSFTTTSNGGSLVSVPKTRLLKDTAYL